MNCFEKRIKYIFITISIILFFSCDSDDNFIEEPKPITKTYKLPVVVHIIHIGESIGEGYNLDNERIKLQISILNNDFRRKEGSLGYNDHPIGADTNIEFQLAEVDPNGNSTNGINRINANDIEIVSDNNSLPFDWLPQYGYWNPNEYINIWAFPGPQNLFLGSATFPHTNLPGHEKQLKTVGDGILINTLHFGISTIESDSNLGRTLTHEMGHFLGLYHLWGKNEKGNCEESNDYCDDTPPVTKRTGECTEETILACNEQHALTQNYMDYIPDSCMNMFTIDQTTRMQYVIEHADRRKLLITSTAISRE